MTVCASPVVSHTAFALQVHPTATPVLPTYLHQRYDRLRQPCRFHVAHCITAQCQVISRGQDHKVVGVAAEGEPQGAIGGHPLVVDVVLGAGGGLCVGVGEVCGRRCEGV